MSWRVAFVRCAALAGALTALTLLPSVAEAQEPFGVTAPAPSPPAFGGTEQAVLSRYWEFGKPRPFFAATIEAGYAYARPRFTLGYGQPYWRWVGLETYPLVSLSNVGHYVGVGAVLPGITARLGARYEYPFGRDYLLPRSSYERVDISRRETETADYLALEAEATATVPVFVGSAFAVLTGIRAEGVPDDLYLFEQSLRAVMEPPYIWRARLGYLLTFGREGAIRLGVASDLIGIPERGEHVVRAGLLGSVLVNAHIEAQASFIPVIVSPDSLGLSGGDFGQLGVRFRWATGSAPDPALLKEAAAKRTKERRPSAE